MKPTRMENCGRQQKNHTIEFLCMYVRTRKKRTNSTAKDYGGCSHAAKVIRGLLVTRESKPTKEKSRNISAVHKTRPLN